MQDDQLMVEEATAVSAETMPTLDDLSQSASVTKELNKNVLFVAVNIHRWRGNRKAKGIEIKLGEEKVKEETVTSPLWKLIPKTWHDQFSEIENEIREVVKRHSLPFPIRGVAVIPRLKALEMFSEIDKITSEKFYPLVDKFVAQWDDMVDELRQTTPPDQFRQMVSQMPQSATAVRHYFSVAKHVIPVGVDLGESYTDEDAAAYAGEIHQATVDFINETAKTLADGLYADLAAAVDNLVERIDDKGVIRAATLDNVRAAMDKLEAFKFLAKPALLDKMQKVRAVMVDVDHASLNASNKHGDGQLVNGLRSVLKSFMNEVDAAGIRGRRRSVEL